MSLNSRIEYYFLKYGIEYTFTLNIFLFSIQVMNAPLAVNIE